MTGLNNYAVSASSFWRRQFELNNFISSLMTGDRINRGIEAVILNAHVLDRNGIEKQARVHCAVKSVIRNKWTEFALIEPSRV